MDPARAATTVPPWRKRTPVVKHHLIVELSLGGATASQLLSALEHHDKGAFTHLVTALDRQLVTLAYLISGSDDVAEDAAQGTWEKLWRKPPRLRDPQKLRSWLLKVCANEARQLTRRRRLRAVLERNSGPRPVAKAAEMRADLIDLKIALGHLAPAERELVGLRFLLGMSSSDIGEHLGLSPEGARTRLHRLLRRLEKELDDV